MSIGIKGMTNSYNSNSCPQMHAIELSIPFIQRAIEVLDLSSLPSTQLLIIADFGSSHGLNSMYAMKTIVIFGLANGRSFYEQCLTLNSLSIGYSSASLQWMSCKQCNISNYCVSFFCSNDEYDKFKQQAHLDYSRFLEYRSNELIPSGVLILCFPCLNDKGLFDFEILFQLLYKCVTLLSIT
ncbi:unnamed protein product, partial [Rotaria sp. Silwood2]